MKTRPRQDLGSIPLDKLLPGLTFNSNVVFTKDGVKLSRTLAVHAMSGCQDIPITKRWKSVLGSSLRGIYTGDNTVHVAAVDCNSDLKKIHEVKSEVLRQSRETLINLLLLNVIYIFILRVFLIPLF
jgi:hypothetical protein